MSGMTNDLCLSFVRTAEGVATATGEREREGGSETRVRSVCMSV